MKFDAARVETQITLNVGAIIRQVGVPPGARILLGGSTHEGEEAVLAEIFLRLRKQFPDLFLILVPRHFERSRDAARAISKREEKELQKYPGLIDEIAALCSKLGEER